MMTTEEWNDKPTGGQIERQARAEGRAEGIRKTLNNIRELNMSGEDENGHRWANSDLIEQEIVFGLQLLDTPSATQPAQVSAADAARVLANDIDFIYDLGQKLADQKPAWRKVWASQMVANALRALSGDRT
jgi:hypothetical protein